jgi:hypothetical protein
LAFVRSSLILANYFTPLSKALSFSSAGSTMDLNLKLSTYLAIYAAGLSTILAILNFMKYRSDSNKDKVKISADLTKSTDYENLVSGMYTPPKELYPAQNSASLFQIKIKNNSEFSVKLDAVRINSDIGDFPAYKKYSISGNSNYHSPIGEDFIVEVPSKEYRKYDVVIPKGSECLKPKSVSISTVCGKSFKIKT